MSDDEGDREVREITDPVKIQEALLRRAQVLKGNIEAFTKEIEAGRPLPPYPTMYARLITLRDGVNDFTTETHKQRDVLSTTSLMPRLNFPARYQMGILDGLLRTKMEPHVEDWEHQHLSAARELENKLSREKRTGALTSLSDKDRKELWNWAAEAAQSEMAKHPWFEADYTLAEKEIGTENIRHGLQRKLVIPEQPGSDDEDELFDDIEDDADNDRADEMDIDGAATHPQSSLQTPETNVKPPMSVDKIHRFMTKGELP